MKLAKDKRVVIAISISLILILLTVSVIGIISRGSRTNTGLTTGNTGNAETSNEYTEDIDSNSPKAIITGEATVVKDGLIRYYDANNNLGNGHSNETKVWKDLSGNYDGIVHGGTFTDSYFELDGEYDWVNIGQIRDKNNITLEASFQLNSIQSGESTILSNFEIGGMGLLLVDGMPRLSVYIENIGYKNITLQEVLDINRVYNISGTYDGKEIKLYIDGVLHASTAVEGTIKNPNDSTTMAIGCNPIENKSEKYFADAKIYSTRIYERALTQEEIQQNMNADRVKPTKLSANNSSTKLTIKFDKEVEGFTEEDIEVTNGTIGALTQISATEYELEVTDILETKDLTVSIKENSYTDVAGNLGEGTSTTRYRDVTGPKPTITANVSNITNANSITYNIKYHEPTTGFTVDDIEVTNGTKGTFTRVSSSEFNLVVTNEGTCKQTISIPAGACYDGAGNASQSASKEITIDKSAPIITVNSEIIYIYNAEDLARFRDSVNAGNDYAGKTVYLMNDIDMSTVCSEQIGSWEPIGTANTNFAGTFDGNYHTISNLYSKTNEYQYLGLFRKQKGIIQNVILKDIYLYNSYQSDFSSTGGIVGSNYGTIQNCGIESGYITGYQKNTTKNTYAGGIAGDNINIIESCYNKAEISGIVNAFGTYKGEARVGGITGGQFGATYRIVQNCYNTGNIIGSGKYAYIGGIIGIQDTATSTGYKTVVQNCYNYGNITATSGTYKFIGGIVGANGISSTQRACTITNSYCTTATTYSYYEELVPLTSGRISEEELKTYATTLGEAYKEDDLNINNGNPILTWQGQTKTVKPESEEPSGEYTKSANIIITAGDIGGVGLSSGNNYQYYLSTSETELMGGEWTNYTSGEQVTIGEGKTGIYYLFVKRVQDNFGGISEETGTLQQIGEETYHRFGPYKFDNTEPKAIITGEATVIKDGLIRYYDANNNLGNGHSNETTVWKDLSGNYDGIINGGTFTDSYLQLDGNDDWVNIGQIRDKNNITLEASFQVNSKQDESVLLCNWQSGGMGIYLGSGKIFGNVYVSNIGYVEIMLNEVIDTNRVYNTSLTYNGKELKLYIDGILHASKEVKGTIKNPTKSTVMAIGVNPKGNIPEVSYVNAKIYSTRIYERALTQEEIQQNMNADRISSTKLSANNDSTKLTIKFDKEVQGFTAEDIEVTNGTKGALTQISTTEYELEVTDIVETEDLTVSIKENSYTDVAGNLGKGTSTTRYRDVTGPIPTITTNVSGTTNSNSITYNIKYHEPTTGFTVDDIEVTNGTKGKFTRISSSEFSIEVTNEGTCKQKISVPAGACYDEAGNASQAGTSKEITIDTTGPIITVNSEITYIYNAENLARFRDSVNAGNDYAGKTVYLMNDIDMSTVCSEQIGSWEPIGATGTSFAGTFDGNYHTISNLYINSDKFNSNIGLFTENNGTIQNLILENVDIYAYKTGKSDFIYAGGIAGYSDGNIINCGIDSGKITAYNTAITGSAWRNVYVGGIAAASKAKVIDCYNKANLTAITYNHSSGKTYAIAGGIIGSARGNTQIENCYNTGDINVVGRVACGGGIAGDALGGKNIINSYSIGSVTGTSSSSLRLGGILVLDTGNDLAIVNSYCGKETTYSKYYANGTGQTAGRVEPTEILKTYATTLGEAYKNDEMNINDGYPILKWQGQTKTVKPESEEPSGEYTKSEKIIITAGDIGGAGLSNDNSYQYYLSTSETELAGGEWTNYTSGEQVTIGEGKTGIYYLFVKRVQDNFARISEETGTMQQIGEEIYHRFGPYKFDNEAPKITKAEVVNNKVKIEASDGEGSGIKKYRYITSNTRLINPRITTENSTEVEATGEITIDNIIGIKYIYVLAEDEVGNTSNIVEVEVVKLSLEGEVNLATEDGQGEVDLNWEINTAGEKTYKVYQKDETSDEWVEVGTTNETKITVTTAKDVAKPNAPKLQVNSINQDNKISINQTATDNGSKYTFYVEAYDREDTDVILATSEEITKEVKTGIKGYYYKIDKTLEENTDNGEYIEANTLELGLENNGSYLTTKAVDVAGNVGEESSIQINIPSKVTIKLDGGTIGENTEEIEVEGLLGETVDLGTPVKEGYTFTGWTATGGTVEGTHYTFESEVGEVTAGWKINSYDYTIEYYYNGTKDESKTITNQAEYGTTIKVYENKIKEGYKFEKTERLPLTITTEASNNVIKVYYVSDENKTKELSYTVEYYKEGEKVEGDTQIVKETVQVLQPNILQVKLGEINTTDKYPGYRFERTNPETIPTTIETGATIKVYYVIDEGQKKEISYTVEYYKEGQKVDSDTQTVKETVQVLQPNTLLVKQEEINITDKYIGYKFERTDPEIMPQTVENGTTIKVYYVKQNNLSYKVNYIDRETNNVIKDPKIVGAQTFEDVIETSTEIIEIEGYTNGEADKERITITANNEENIINIYYTKRKDLSYTVNYLDENGDKIHESQVVENQEYGKVITGKEIAIEIEGHTYDESTEQETLTIGTDTSKNIINIYYIKRSDIKYTINYLEKDTNEVIHEAKEEEGVYGGKIKAETEKIDIPGYTNAIADKEEITIEVDETKNVINIYYEKRTDIPYKVEYYYNGEKDESRTVNGIATYKEIIDSYEDKIIEGYILVKEKGIPLTITSEEGKNVIEIHYAKKTQIKVQYIEKDTDKLIEEIVEEGYVGKECNTVSKNFDSYVLVEEPKEKQITMTEDEVIVKYYYAYVSSGVIEKHIDMDTGEILFNTIHEGNEGDEYKIDAKEIEGYELIQEELPTNSQGTMRKDAITVTYYYKKKEVITITVKYIDKETNEAVSEEVVIEGYEGKEYKTEKKEISGYEVYNIVGKQEGKMTTNEEVIYYYQKVKVPDQDVNMPGGNTGENGGPSGSEGEITDTTISNGKLPSAGLSKQQITIIAFVAISITMVALVTFAIKGTITYKKYKR